MWFVNENRYECCPLCKCKDKIAYYEKKGLFGTKYIIMCERCNLKISSKEAEKAISKWNSQV